MKTLRNIILTAGMLSLTGCTAFTSFSEVEALNDAQAVGSPFTQSLAGEYREFANNELKEMFDYPDALHFARKGLAAASGNTVLPEPIADWNLNESHVQELSASRGRIIVAFDLGAREQQPALSAKTQARFDCWIESQEEHWLDTSVIACKQQFIDAINQLEAELQSPAPVITQSAEEPIAFDVNVAQPMEIENAMYLVFFDWDSSKLGNGALNVLDAIKKEISENPPGTVNVVGHADTSGPKTYNTRLAFKRANMVRDALVQRGVDANLIAVDAKGEEELLVSTPDSVREPANRRVNISFN
ncbi:MAG: OmpA family protein [Alphaproteobacteria bacterium]|nr:OmpA family protein [Alphaproteobacteria bacterium]